VKVERRSAEDELGALVIVQAMATTGLDIVPNIDILGVVELTGAISSRIRVVPRKGLRPCI
jgi:hypothetical protein